MQNEGLFGAACVLVALVAIVLYLERESTRPDALVRAIYLREALAILPRLAITIGIASPALELVRSLTLLLIWVGAAFVLLRPSSDTSGRHLWLAALAVPVTAIATDLTITDIDRGPNTLQDQLTFALLVTALWRAPRLDPATITRYAKLVVGVMLATSALAIAAGLPGAPNLDSPQTIPVIGRWSGTFPHANSYGPAGVLYLVLERLQPSRLRVRVPMVVSAVAAIVLSQSKTAWAAALIVGTILAVAGWARRRAVFAALTAASFAALGTLMLGTERFDVDQTPLGTVSTLTGRTDLWALGLERWQESPWFGAGSGVFLDIAERTGQEWAGQAHNAYVSALAEHGIVGLLAVLGYLGALGAVALRHARATRNASVALLALLLVRTMTETPLMQFGYEEVTILALAFAWDREAPPPIALPPRRGPGEVVWAGGLGSSSRAWSHRSQARRQPPRSDARW
jgi:O-antigen ligase